MEPAWVNKQLRPVAESNLAPRSLPRALAPQSREAPPMTSAQSTRSQSVAEQTSSQRIAKPSLASGNERSPSTTSSVAPEPRFDHTAAWLVAIVIAWALGLLFTILRLALHQAAVARLRRACVPIFGNDWASVLDQASRQLNLTQRVALLLHPDAASPITAGIRNPFIILPANAANWTAAHRQSVLLHELAHVKRRDVLTQFLAGAACALHWFNPLAWYGSAQMRKLRELACDDLVLAAGERPADYAELLLHVARSYRHRRLASAVGMARSSNVENRIVAILDSARNRLPLSRRAAIASFAAAAVVVATLGTMRLESRAQSAAEPKQSPPTEATAAAKSESATKPPEAKTNPDERILEVLITDEAGAQLHDAKVYYSLCYKIGEKHECPHGEITTDEKGQASVEIPAGTANLKLWASKPDYVPEFVYFPESAIEGGKNLPAHYEFQLAKGTNLSGRVVDEAGQPIAGAKVEVEVEVNEPAWGRDPNPMISTRLTPIPVTDADGRWEINNAPAPAGEKDYEFRLKITHGDFTSDTQRGQLQREQGVTTPMLRDGTATIVLSKGVTVEGIVVDAAGNPVTKGWVVWHDEPYFTQGDWESGLDGEGRFRTLPLADGEHPIIVVAPGYAAERRMVNVKSGMDALKFSLQAGKRTSIRFVDAEGNAIPNAGVYVGASSGPNTWNSTNALHNQSGSGVPDYGIPRKANDEGLYVWEWAPDGAVTYNVGAKGFASQKLSFVPKSTPHVVTLHDDRVVAGTATDAETGKPIASFSAMPVIVFSENHYHTRREDAKLGHDGQYEVPLTGSADPTDHYRVRFEADGYESLVTDKSFGPHDGRSQLDVKLKPAAARTGQVVDAEGQPVERALVLQASHTDVPDFSDGKPESYGSDPIRTDAQGAFSFRASSEPVLIRAVHDAGFIEVRREPGEPIGKLQLRPWAKVEGRLIQDGKPVGNQLILFSPIPTGNKLGEPRFQDSYQEQTDPDGKFVFNRLPPGFGALRAHLGPWRESPLTSAESVPLDLKPGEHHTILFGDEGAALTGKVVPTGRDEVPLDAHWSLNYLVSRQANPLPPNFPNSPSIPPTANQSSRPGSTIRTTTSGKPLAITTSSNLPPRAISAFTAPPPGPTTS